MMMEAEIKKMLLQAKEYRGLPANRQELGERHRTDAPSEPSELWDNKVLLSKPLRLWYLVLTALANSSFLFLNGDQS